MALVGVDVEVPKCGDHPAVPRAECRKITKRERLTRKKFYKRKRAVEKEKKNGENCDAFIFEKQGGKSPDTKEEEGKSEGAWDIEGPVQPESDFRKHPDEQIKKKVIADGLPGEYWILGGPIVSHGEGADKRDVAAKVTPECTGDQNIFLRAIVTEGMEHEEEGECKEYRNNKGLEPNFFHTTKSASPEIFRAHAFASLT